MKYQVNHYVIIRNFQIFIMVTVTKGKVTWFEMIIYGCINGKLKNKRIEDISIKKAHNILK